MLVRYANIIEEVFRADTKVKPCSVVGKVLEALNMEDGKQPSDLPSAQKIMWKVGSVKEKLKKERGKGS